MSAMIFFFSLKIISSTSPGNTKKKKNSAEEIESFPQSCRPRSVGSVLSFPGFVLGEF